jgi:hypothetical protein
MRRRDLRVQQEDDPRLRAPMPALFPSLVASGLPVLLQTVPVGAAALPPAERMTKRQPQRRACSWIAKRSVMPEM